MARQIHEEPSRQPRGEQKRVRLAVQPTEVIDAPLAVDESSRMTRPTTLGRLKAMIRFGDLDLSPRDSERGSTAAARRNEALAEKKAKAAEALKAQEKKRKREEYSKAGKGPLASVTVLVQKTLKREGRKVVKAIQRPRFLMVEVPNKTQAEKGGRPIEDESALREKGGSDSDDDGPQPDTDQRVWDGEDHTDTDQGVAGVEVLAEGDLVEGEEVDPFAYKESLAAAGENAIFDPSMTPDEIANMTEDYANYAGTHEQER